MKGQVMAIKKPKNTGIFSYENLNPYKRKAGDCVIRAVAKSVYEGKTGAFGDAWKYALDGLCNVAMETGYMINTPDCYGRLLERKGFKKHKQPRHENGTKYTLKEFIAEHKTGTYVVNMPHHLTTVKNGKCYDTWNWTQSDRRVGNYWEK